MGVYFGNNKEECEKLNSENKIDKMNILFFSWGKRNLTILGKFMIIKALVITIFTFVVLNFYCAYVFLSTGAALRQFNRLGLRLRGTMLELSTIGCSTTQNNTLQIYQRTTIGSVLKELHA
jgi:hypothetical protein